MPVLDHPTHEKTVGGDRYAACQKRIRHAGYWAKNGWELDESGRPTIQKWTWIEDQMSKGCMYDSSKRDTKCAGCELPCPGEAYAERVIENGA